MCGITAILRPAGLRDHEPATLRAMRDALSHRGPDAATDAIVDGWAALGHRRLSIVDVGGSAQPLWSEDRSIGVVFNGEIYNFQGLRAQLVERGHVFSTHGDGETLVHGYEEWGDAVCERLEGMWAFVLVDRRRRRALVARDRFGIKPVFWAPRSGGVLVASEIKGLLAHPEVERVGDLDALRLGSLRYHVPWPRTAFHRVYRLPPGALLAVSSAGEVATRRFAPMVAPARADLTGEDAVRAVEDAVRAAVKRQMVADVPVGAFLSGGIDSTLLVALMREHARGPLHTFSVGFPVADESPVAEATARRLGTEHHALRMDELSFDELAHLPELYDEPFAETSALGVLALSRHAGQRVKVALSGDGGDELFAGYPAARHVAAMFEASAWLPAPLREGVGRKAARLAPLLDGRAAQAMGYLAQWSGDPAAAMRYLASSRATSPWWPADHAHSERASAAAGGSPPVAPLRAALWAGRLENLPNAMLTKVDVASMRASIEVRVPLLDDAVVRVSDRVAPQDLIGGGFGKRVLRRVLERVDPGAPVWAKKQGFALPLDRWLEAPTSRAAATDLFERTARRVCDLGLEDARPAWQAFLDGRTRTSRATAARQLLWAATIAWWAERFDVRVSERAPLDGTILV